MENIKWIIILYLFKNNEYEYSINYLKKKIIFKILKTEYLDLNLESIELIQNLKK